METMEEITAVTEAVRNIGTSWFWVGGKYNSTSGKYYWVGSGVDVDAALFFPRYPPRYNNINNNLVLMRPRPKVIPLRSSFNSLCEEY